MSDVIKTVILTNTKHTVPSQQIKAVFAPLGRPLHIQTQSRIRNWLAPAGRQVFPWPAADFSKGVSADLLDVPTNDKGKKNLGLVSRKLSFSFRSLAVFVPDGVPVCR